MNKTYYVCKYTPIELLAAYGAECVNLNNMPEGFDNADQIAHPNMCGFGKAVLEDVMNGRVHELVLVNCCDSIKSVYDLLADRGTLDFIYMVDMLHTGGSCSRERVTSQLVELAQAYGAYTGRTFDLEKFRTAFAPRERMSEPHIAVLGARMGDELYQMTKNAMPLPVANETCVNNRSVGAATMPQMQTKADDGGHTVEIGRLSAATAADDSGEHSAGRGVFGDLSGTAFTALMEWYAGELIGQLPCMRMIDNAGRKNLYQDPSLRGIIYHTVKFCDFYSFEYAEIKNHSDLPLLKIESDYTVQSSGQLSTRLEAFAESLEVSQTEGGLKMSGKGYFAGIDSGSTSTDVVILDKNCNIFAEVIMPTGAGAANGADRALEAALSQAGLAREDIDAVVTTGYGRTAIQDGDKSITEITCHARGAHYLDPEVRVVVDIGGQDSKVIRLNEDGTVKNFVMNDKCAAGTGRFLEMMARTMEMSLEDLSKCGLTYDEDITISSMCTVFAESEVVSLVAQNKKTDDIVHGLNKAVASKTASLAKRVGTEGKYMMTGGVAKNEGLVKVLEERLGAPLEISEKSQLCGALGAALFALDMAKEAVL